MARPKSTPAPAAAAAAAAPMSAIAARKARHAAAAAAVAAAKAGTQDGSAEASPARATRSRTNSNPKPPAATTPSTSSSSSKATPKSRAKAEQTAPASAASKKAAPAPTPLRTRRASMAAEAANGANGSSPSTPSKVFLTGTDPQVVIPLPSPASRLTPATKQTPLKTSAKTSARKKAAATPETPAASTSAAVVVRTRTPASATRTRRRASVSSRSSPQQVQVTTARASSRAKPSPRTPAAATTSAARTTTARARTTSSARKRKARPAAAEEEDEDEEQEQDEDEDEEEDEEEEEDVDRIVSELRGHGEDDDEEQEAIEEVQRQARRSNKRRKASEPDKSKSRQQRMSPDLDSPTKKASSRYFAGAADDGATKKGRRAAAHSKFSEEEGEGDEEEAEQGEEDGDVEMGVASDEEAAGKRATRTRSSTRAKAAARSPVKPKERARRPRAAAQAADDSGFVAFDDVQSEGAETPAEDEDEEMGQEEAQDQELAADVSSDEDDERSSELDEDEIATPSKYAAGKGKTAAALLVDEQASGATTPVLGQSIAVLMGDRRAASLAAKKPTIPYSRFVPITGGAETNYMVDMINERPEAITFGLNQGESLAFVGIARVIVLKGKLRVGAATLSDVGDATSIDVFAPAGYPIPALEALGASGSDRTIALAEGLDCDGFSVIVRVEELRSDIQSIGRACPVSGLEPFALSSRVKVAELPCPSTFQMLIAPADDDESSAGASAWAPAANASLAALETPANWTGALDHLAGEVVASKPDLDDPVVALVRGAKKVGKSTFVKMAINAILAASGGKGIDDAATTAATTKVALLDLDLGQSEYGPPGSVVLHVFEQRDLAHGPGWCLPRAAARSHFVGDTSPKDDPASYVQAIEELVGWYRAEVQRDAATGQLTPLVVNTQGWVKGLGADLGMRIETLLCPTHVYELVAPVEGRPPLSQTYRGEAYIDPYGAILAQGPSVTTLSGAASAFVAATGAGSGNGATSSTGSNMISSSNTRLSAADARTMSLVSWFHATELASAGGPARTQWNFGRPVLAIEPLVIDVAAGLRGGLHVLPFGSSVPDTLKLSALNGSIVSVVSVPLLPTPSSTTAATAESGSGGDNQAGSTTSVWQHAFGLPRPSPSTGAVSLGLALVRSVDPAGGAVHIVTPLAVSTLAAAAAAPGRGLALVKGAIDLPVWLSLDFDAVQQAREGTLDGEGTVAGVEKEQVPFLEWPRNEAESEGVVGTKKRRVRKNLMRRAQM
ncbi:uncharacterized protein PFL1_04390 [Pseudozyma flocculosa PF-1]|uniref:Polynucleotide 5'-hydroxyl-kinase GRC3 n=2 Tax=Pseudozyma flocculosa TaxID=84751 RepID=A0A5C3FEV7_9BASI|nr:uncharacterized protein PFL1_04390 [Pseudozyma flocculosa PF-1]EPQ28063.1 hypothetical protein PFL1_04390 [Pseudozyma flocculosa PF-1]SPO42185.1 uncharacterized protein PSFLO_07668 [Pseudozyma flocculosa]